jgi:type 1 fimbriae regulatory protein FimE
MGTFFSWILFFSFWSISVFNGQHYPSKLDIPNTASTMRALVEKPKTDKTNPHNTKIRPPPPKRRKNIELRSREYLTPREVDELTKAAGSVGRHRHRDKSLVLVGYRHALRITELVSLRWDQIDFINKVIHVNRIKRGTPSLHPLHDIVINALRVIQGDATDCPYIFINNRGSMLSASTARKIIVRAGVVAGFPFSIHPHMLRHACGFYLANKGFDTRSIQHYMGHRNIQHTVRYTELTSERFKGFWED